MYQAWGRWEILTKFWFESLNVRGYSLDLPRLRCTDNIAMDLRKLRLKVWIEFVWFRKRTSDRFF